MNSLFPDICSNDLAASKTFYESLLGMHAVFELDWYIQLQSPTDATVQVAFVAQDHESVPTGYGFDPRGVIVTVELDDVDSVYRQAQTLEVPIVQTLRDEEWGQRHFMARDPNGLLVDIVQMIEPGKVYAHHFQ